MRQDTLREQETGMSEDPQASDQHIDSAADADAHAAHVADREPTAQEEKDAETSARSVDVAEVADHYEEMAERGANVAGEGQIEP